MGIKHFTALAAALIIAAPAAAFDDLRDTGPSTMFYLSIPLDARTAKEQRPAFGLQLQGQRAYETVRIDSRMFSFLPLGGLELKWVVVGGVAVAAAVAAGSKDKAQEQQFQQAQQQQAAQQQQQGHFPGDGCGPCDPNH
jgi:hypothetical protein